MYIVWNVDRARPANKRPLTSNRAGRLADLFERRTGDIHTLLGVK